MEYILYAIPTIALAIYFEILGKTIVTNFGFKKPSFGLPIGYFTVIGLLYVLTGIKSANCIRFIDLALIYLLLFLISIYFIIKSWKKIKFDYKLISVVVVVFGLIFLTYCSWHTTLGDLNGFDTTFYLNIVGNNASSDYFNKIYAMWGVNVNNIDFQYAFQSYYNFASVILGIYQKALSALGQNYYVSTGFIWTFQILFNLTFLEIIEDTVNSVAKDKTTLHVFAVVLLVAFYGRYYFNNVFGFYGNTMRTLSISYATLSFYWLIKEDDYRYKYLLYICLLAACGFSSSGTFISFLYLFALAFVIYKYQGNFILEYAIVAFVPMANILCTIFHYTFKENIWCSFLVCLVIVLISPLIKKIFCNKKARIVLLAIIAFSIVAISLYLNGFQIDLDAFLNNNGKTYDMVINYTQFYINDLLNAKNIYIFITYCSFALSLLDKKEKELRIINLILIICFFNPISCILLNKINMVYYRAYELMINPVLIILYLNIISNILNFKLMNIYSLALSTFMLFSFNIGSPLYFHKSFIPDSDYNALYKMSNAEFDTINELKDLCLNIDRPKIVTANQLTQSMLQKGLYIYTREYKQYYDWTTSEQNIYYMFYPSEYYDINITSQANYESMNDDLLAAEIDYLVIDKNMEYYDKELDIYYPLSYVVGECECMEVCYQNDSYIIYKSIND